jgi:hypothetical protein
VHGATTLAATSRVGSGSGRSRRRFGATAPHRRLTAAIVVRTEGRLLRIRPKSGGEDEQRPGARRAVRRGRPSAPAECELSSPSKLSSRRVVTRARAYSRFAPSCGGNRECWCSPAYRDGAPAAPAGRGRARSGFTHRRVTTALEEPIFPRTSTATTRSGFGAEVALALPRRGCSGKRNGTRSITRVALLSQAARTRR